MRRFDRRAVLAGAGALGLLASPSALGFAVERREATKIPAEPDYDPPVNLKAVADLYRRMTAPVRINGRGPFPFVDTGANQSVVSEALARQLGLPRGPMEVLNSTTGVMMAPTTTARLDVGRRAESGVTLSVLPERSMGGLGMLGVDRLAGQRLTLDFANERLLIEPTPRLTYRPDDVVMPALRRDGQLTLTKADLSGVPVTAFIDSGSESTIGNLALEALVLSRRPQAIWDTAPVVSVTGQVVTAEIGSVAGLRIGGMRLPTWPVAFADLHTFKLWNLTSQPALMIGVDVMSRFSAVSLDFLRNEVRFHDVAQASSTGVV